MKDFKIVFRSSYGGYLHYYIAWGLIFFSTIASLFNFIPGTVTRNFMVGIFIVFLLICSMLKGINRNIFLWIVLMIGITLINGYYLKNPNIYTVNFVPYLTFICALVLCWVGEMRIDWVDIYLKGALVAYCIYAGVTVITRFLPSLYINHIAPILAGSNSQSLVAFYKSGCMAGLTLHYSINGMLITVGVLIIYSKILLYKKTKKDYLIFGVMILALLFTGKRGHLIFALLSMLVVYFINSGKKIGTRWWKILRAIVLIIFAGIIIYKYVPAARVVFDRIVEMFESDDITNNRTRWWNVAITYFKQNILFGIGWGNFAGLCARVEGYYAHCHNVYLQLLCETGIVGFTIYISWMVKCLHCAFKNFIYARDIKMQDEKDYYFMGFSLGYQIFFLLYCFTGNPLYDEEMFIPYFISCAISLYYRKRILRGDIKAIQE